MVLTLCRAIRRAFAFANYWVQGNRQRAEGRSVWTLIWVCCREAIACNGDYIAAQLEIKHSGYKRAVGVCLLMDLDFPKRWWFEQSWSSSNVGVHLFSDLLQLPFCYDMGAPSRLEREFCGCSLYIAGKSSELQSDRKSNWCEFSSRVTEWGVVWCTIVPTLRTIL